MCKDEKVLELESLLNKVKSETKYEVFKPCIPFSRYEVSNYGHVKSPSRIVTRKAPRGSKFFNYFIKEKYLKYLHTGIDQRWVTVILVNEKQERRQVSVAKLIASAFLNIDVNELPRQIYYIDGDPKNVTLNNISFLRTR